MVTKLRDSSMPAEFVADTFSSTIDGVVDVTSAGADLEALSVADSEGDNAASGCARPP